MKLVIFDLDATLTPHRVSNVAPFERRFLDNVEAKCRQLRESGTTLAIASNQGGLVCGLKVEEVEEHFRWVCEQLGIAAWRYAWDKERRKPEPAMLLELMEQFGVAPGETCFVGDAATDELAARAAHVRFFYAADYFRDLG